MLERKSNFRAWLYLLPALALLGLYTFYPLFNAFFLAFTVNYHFEFDVLLGKSKAVVDGFTIFGNFAEIVKGDAFKRALKNTAAIVFVSVPISVTVALLVSVALNSIKKLQGFFQTIFFLPYVTNAIAVGLAFAFLFDANYGLINMVLGWVGIDKVFWIQSIRNEGAATWISSMSALLIYTVWGGLAFKIMVFLSGLQSIDKQYYDAARIDATPKKRVFTKITVPLLSPMIAYITITSFIGAFKAYRTVVAMFGISLTPRGSRGTELKMDTLVSLVYDALDASSESSYSYAAATSIILFLITLTFTLINMWVSKKRVHF
jgi:multiple sugar transport system permease protein